jgi:hypothetical protein
LEGRILSAVTLNREAAKAGVWIGLNGDRLALKASAKPPDELLARLKPDKAELFALLWQAACSVKNGWRPLPMRGAAFSFGRKDCQPIIAPIA